LRDPELLIIFLNGFAFLILLVFLFFYLKLTNGLKEIKKEVNPIFSIEYNLRINCKR